MYTIHIFQETIHVHSWMHLKEPRKPGRQPGVTPSALLHHINTIAPQKIMGGKNDPALAPTQVISVIDLLKFPMCKGMLSQPLKLHCDVVVCAKCVVDAITTSASTRCPCCEDAVNLLPSSVQPASDIIQRLQCDVIILCETCNRDVRAGDYDSHECQKSGVLEEQMACKVIRRILSESTSDNILQIKTGGTVRYKNEVGNI